VVRHAQAHTCRLGLALGAGLELDIRDDGIGLPPNAHAGVGWTSMRERAAELGGSCTVTSRPEGGLLVRAVLPLGMDHPAEGRS
jgi:signal transduction histidine kinase